LADDDRTFADARREVASGAAAAIRLALDEDASAPDRGTNFGRSARRGVDLIISALLSVIKE
jgi:hypothetical protein